MLSSEKAPRVAFSKLNVSVTVRFGLGWVKCKCKCNCIRWFGGPDGGHDGILLSTYLVLLFILAFIS